jgi:hypothetical protein
MMEMLFTLIWSLHIVICILNIILYSISVCNYYMSIKNQRLGVVAHTCNLGFSGGGSKRITDWGQLWQKHDTLSEK